MKKETRKKKPVGGGMAFEDVVTEWFINEFRSCRWQHQVAKLGIKQLRGPIGLSFPNRPCGALWSSKPPSPP